MKATTERQENNDRREMLRNLEALANQVLCFCESAKEKTTDGYYLSQNLDRYDPIRKVVQIVADQMATEYKYHLRNLI